MYGRRYQRKRGFKRIMVTLLTLVMLASVCFPGLRANAGEIEEQPGAFQTLSAGIEELQKRVAALSESQDFANDYAGAAKDIDDLGVKIADAQKEGQISSEDFETLSVAFTALQEVFKKIQSPVTQNTVGDEITDVSSSVASESSVEATITETTQVIETTQVTETTSAPTEETSLSYLEQLNALYEEVVAVGASAEASIYEDIYNRTMAVYEEAGNPTVEENEELYGAVGSIVMTLQGYGYDPYAVSYFVSQSTRFIPTIENADVAYMHWNGNNPSIEFTPVTGTFTANWNNDSNHYFLFFVKPHDNYLLTGLGADGNGDIYPTTGTKTSDFGNISSYPSIVEIAEKAREAGYVAMFGYFNAKGTPRSDTSFNVICQSPGIQVTASSDKTTNVKPNDALNFTVTIKPEVPTGKYVPTVEGVEIDKITINGRSVEYSSLVENSDGTYTATVPYVATAQDCAEGNVTLSVTATVSYSGKLTISDTTGDTGSIGTTASVTSTASTICLIAPKNQVMYKHTYSVPDGITITTYPDAITGNPVDNTQYYEGHEVTVDNTYGQNAVTDTLNGGTWTFDGWYLNDQKVTKATMTKDGLTFTGVWKFERTLYDVTVEKVVTGNMGDWKKDFSFTVNCDGSTQNFTLKNGESKTIEKLPVGKEIVVTETNNDGYTVTYRLSTDHKDADAQVGSTVTTTVSEGLVITFINNKEATIDTGIFTDTAPYILLFSIAAVGAAVVLMKKRRVEY